ncbi:hypothetical protein NLG97_g10325 [Lecanicillium saksenae]|uniref:Uncharacterized protein n=1 Tax=Lecanicillium saksenae TaxID=468837 RepID=A0ACC1QGI9_9HYPO|nr:hypothetical protein NLG97_g10325 [Lecanicillium saksenae]
MLAVLPDDPSRIHPSSHQFTIASCIGRCPTPRRLSFTPGAYAPTPREAVRRPIQPRPLLRLLSSPSLVLLRTLPQLHRPPYHPSDKVDSTRAAVASSGALQNIGSYITGTIDTLSATLDSSNQYISATLGVPPALIYTTAAAAAVALPVTMSRYGWTSTTMASPRPRATRAASTPPAPTTTSCSSRAAASTTRHTSPGTRSSRASSRSATSPSARGS